jgi:hypothetical protein
MSDMIDDARDVAEEGVQKAESLEQPADQVTDKIPGEKDDEAVDEGKSLIDKAKDLLHKG